jgi:hypothetical protein
MSWKKELKETFKILIYNILLTKRNFLTMKTKFL